MNVYRILLYVLFAVSFVSCKMHADQLLYNGVFYRGNADTIPFSALAISGEQIVYTGTEAGALRKYRFRSKTDLQGAAVVPGFIDAHAHFYGYGLGLSRCNLIGTRSFDEVLQRVQQWAAENPDGWVLGRGWDQNDWSLKQFPSCKQLDSLFPDRPVYLTRIDGHAALVNKKALQLSGISAPALIEGGEIMGNNGKCNGILIDNAMELVNANIPEPDDKAIDKALLLAQDSCLYYGITALAEAGLGRKVIDRIGRLQQDGQLKMRIYAMLDPGDPQIMESLAKGIQDNGMLSVRSVKLYSDGALGSRGAMLKQPYCDRPASHGALLHQPQYFDSMCRLLYEKGFQVNTHCIGDSANHLILETYGRYLKGKNDLRWRIEHAQIMDIADIGDFGKYSIIPSVQPTHFTSDMYWAEDRLCRHRLRGAYAYRSLLEQNGWMPLGTDFPVEHPDPLRTYASATLRADARGFVPISFAGSEHLDRWQTLQGMTSWAARSCFWENLTGTLAPGFKADMTVLKRIPDPASIRENQVTQTWINGKQVFKTDK